MKKEIARLRRLAEDCGWTVEHTRGNHLRWLPPDGGSFVISSATPSDHRALLNLRAHLRQRGLPAEPGRPGRAADADTAA